MVVASFAVRMATLGVGPTGMWEHGLRKRNDEKCGEQKIAEWHVKIVSPMPAQAQVRLSQKRLTNILRVWR